MHTWFHVQLDQKILKGLYWESRMFAKNKLSITQPFKLLKKVMLTF